MADQLPSSIQLGFDGLRAHMGQFSSKFDGFVERSRKQVLEERNRFHLNLTELRGAFFYPNGGRFTPNYLIELILLA